MSCNCTVYACEKFNHYILGRSVKIKTDHKPLKIIFKKIFFSASKRLQRMLRHLQKYCLNVVYVVDSKLYIADFLFRTPSREPKK